MSITPRRRQRRSRALVGLAVLAIIGAISCKTTSPAQVDVERVIEQVDAPAPVLPSRCEDKKHDVRLVAEPEGTATSVEVLLFSSDWCDACDRVLGEFAENAMMLSEQGVGVRHLVTQSDGSCLDAARVGRRAPFVYHALNANEEADWAIRSTPTLWVIRGDRALLYIEGEVTVEELLALLER